jgi:hypothetical protein
LIADQLDTVDHPNDHGLVATVTAFVTVGFSHAVMQRTACRFQPSTAEN